MVKAAVQVYVRTRPTVNFSEQNFQINTQENSFRLHRDRGAKDATIVNNNVDDWQFRYDGILHNASQDQVYESVAFDIVDSVLKGYNGTMLAYGQTGAGKTFTMSGGTIGRMARFNQRGVIPRAIHHVFESIAHSPEFAYSVRISYCEIYNETLYDLLSPQSSDEQPELSIMEDQHGQVYVRGLTQVIAHTEEEALNAMFEGETNRSIGEHQLNKSSTRSHCILTVYIESRSRVESSPGVKVSKLNLVDLAGSERLKKTGSDGIILSEAKYINKSLTFLEQVVVALCDKQREHVPYRQSKLTNLLRDSIGGNSRTAMVACVWPEVRHLDETISTLKFATRMMRVHNEVSANVRQDPVQLVKKYEREIQELKQELSMHDALANRHNITYEPFSQAQRYELSQMVQQYLRGDIEEIDVVNLRQIRETFMQFKVILNNMRSQVEDEVRQKLITEGVMASSGHIGSIAGDHRGSVPDTDGPGENVEVGDVGEGGGFGVGVAPPAAKPERAKSTPRGSLVDEGLRPVSSGRSATNPTPSTMGKRSPMLRVDPPYEGLDGNPPRVDKKVAFESYVQEEGLEFQSALAENVESLKLKKRQKKELGMRVNRHKREIDRLNDLISEKRQIADASGETGRSGNNVIDEEEYRYFKELKEHRHAYKEAFQEFKAVKSELEYCNRLVDQCRTRLFTEFSNWYNARWPDNSTSRSLGDLMDGKETVGSTHRQQNSKREDDEELLDDAELFRRMEEENMKNEDPNAAPYYRACKAVASHTKPRASPRKRRP
eukprot:Rmarinus@m.10756